MNIKITKTTNPKPIPNPETLPFGTVYTDHMFVMDYADGTWGAPEIVPYANLDISPATIVFHYAQSVFEGMKAYRTSDGKILLFRPEENMKRLLRSCRRMCIPEFDEQLVLSGLKKLVNLDRGWVPTLDGASLYIRPFIIATDPCINVIPSQTYKLMIICSPCKDYSGGLTPTKIKAEENCVRACLGGTGDVKASANYAVSLASQATAAKEGCSQVLWLDAKEHKYIEEVGAMNVFFVVDGKVVTPELTGSILPGVTRASAITILRDMGYEVVETKLSIDDCVNNIKSSALSEAFGTGTAVVVSPISAIRYRGVDYEIGSQVGEVARKLYDKLTGIQFGKIQDEYNWVVEVG